MNLARRLNAGKIATQGFSVASATAEYRGDSSVANATLSFRTRPFPALKSRAKFTDAMRQNQTEPVSAIELCLIRETRPRLSTFRVVRRIGPQTIENDRAIRSLVLPAFDIWAQEA